MCFSDAKHNLTRGITSAAIRLDTAVWGRQIANWTRVGCEFAESADVDQAVPFPTVTPPLRAVTILMAAINL